MASPECTNHSVAKGNKPRCEKSKATAMQVVRFARALRPRWLVVENVVSMKNWSRYEEFIANIERLGYKTYAQALNAADFGVPQSRRRLFILCDMERIHSPIPLPRRKRRTVREIIDGNGTYQHSPLSTEPPTSNYLYPTGQNRSFHIFYPIIHLTFLTPNSPLPTLYQPFLLLFDVRGQLVQLT